MYRVFSPIEETTSDMLQIVGVINPLSMSLTRSAVSVGAFNMTVEFNELNRELTKLDNIVEVVQDQCTMGIITSRSFDLDRDLIMVSGHELKVIFDWKYTSRPANIGEKWNCGELPFSEYLKATFRLDSTCPNNDPDFVYEFKKAAPAREQHVANLVDYDFSASQFRISDSDYHEGVYIACTECETLTSLLGKYSEASHEYPLVKIVPVVGGDYVFKLDWFNVQLDSEKFIIFDENTTDRGRVFTESNEGRVDIFSTFGERYFYSKREKAGSDQKVMFYQEREKLPTTLKGVFCRHLSEDTELKCGDTIDFSSTDPHYTSDGTNDMTWGDWHRIYTNLSQEIFYAVQSNPSKGRWQNSNMIQCNEAMTNGYLLPDVTGKTKGSVSNYECTVSQLDIDADLYDTIWVKDLELGLTKKCFISEIQYVMTGSTIEKIYTISEIYWIQKSASEVKSYHTMIDPSMDAGMFVPSSKYFLSRYQIEKTINKADITNTALISNESITVKNVKSLDITLETDQTTGTYRIFAIYPMDATEDVVRPGEYVATGGTQTGSAKKLTQHFDFPDAGVHTIPIKALMRTYSSNPASMTYWVTVNNVEIWD